jgi:hypothetical protein
LAIVFTGLRDMQRELPPYRADHVGSLLRTPALKQARGKFAAGQLTAAELKAVEDAEIRAVIAKQEAAGLRPLSALCLDQSPRKRNIKFTRRWNARAANTLNRNECRGVR